MMLLGLLAAVAANANGVSTVNGPDPILTAQATGNKMPSSNLAIIISPNILRVCSGAHIY